MAFGSWGPGLLSADPKTGQPEHTRPVEPVSKKSPFSFRWFCVLWGKKQITSISNNKPTVPHKTMCFGTSQPKTPAAPTEGIFLKTTGGLAPSACMANGWMKLDEDFVKGEDGKRTTFRLKGGKYNSVWTLHFSESLQLWYLGSTGAEDMITMLEEKKDMKENMSCYVHDAGVPLSEGKWTMTWMPQLVYSRDSTPNTIEIGWIGEDVFGIEQYGVVAATAAAEVPAAAAVATSQIEIDGLDMSDPMVKKFME